MLDLTLDLVFKIFRSQNSLLNAIKDQTAEDMDSKRKLNDTMGTTLQSVEIWVDTNTFVIKWKTKVIKQILRDGRHFTTYAVKNGQIEVLEFIAENVSDKDPMTPLLIVAAQGKIEVFKIKPLDFGRSVNPISTRRGRLCPPHYYWIF